MSRTPPTSICEWLELEELAIPTVDDEEQPGRVFRIEAVGIVKVQRKPSLGVDHDPSDEEAASTLDLPVVTILDGDGRPRDFRLPGELAVWVVGCLSVAAEMDERLFPAEVELGRLRDGGCAFARFARRQPIEAVH